MDFISLLALVAALALGLVLGMRQAAEAKRALAAAEEREERREVELRERLDEARKAAQAEAQGAVSGARGRLEEERRKSDERISADDQRIRGRSEELDRRAERAEQREQDLGRREARLAGQEAEIEQRREQLGSLRRQALLALEEASSLSPEQAREQILVRVREDSKDAAARQAKQIEDGAREDAERKAKNIISLAIQRYAGDYVSERTVSVVPLPSDELKGRIIGREGRNIRALEAATGVDFIIDDTPQTIVISGFNPIRRQIARIAIESLLEDGRIHPTRIERVVRKAEAEFHKTIRAVGRQAAEEVGVGGIHPELLKLVGALKYRTSYGQNQWQHALEVAFLCGMMAAELGLDERKAKRAGLLHDVGKVLDQTAEGSHALIGAEFARKHGEQPDIVNAIASHHEEVPQESVYACLAQAADAISGARPGARREMMQSYTQRLTDLERISNSFPGVERSYAVQAGRELRILVENGQVTDQQAVLLSRDIAQKIQNEMTYPGQIKVTVIRETRVVQYAR